MNDYNMASRGIVSGSLNPWKPAIVSSLSLNQTFVELIRQSLFKNFKQALLPIYCHSLLLHLCLPSYVGNIIKRAGKNTDALLRLRKTGGMSEPMPITEQNIGMVNLLDGNGN